MNRTTMPPPPGRVLCVYLQAIITGRRAFFYSYDVATGKVLKVPRIFSSGRAEKHVETFAASPDGKWLAFIGSEGDCLLAFLPSFSSGGGWGGGLFPLGFTRLQWRTQDGWLWLDMK